MDTHSDDRFADNIMRYVDGVMPDHAPAEDSGDENDSPSPEEIDYLLGGYQRPEYERNGR